MLGLFELGFERPGSPIPSGGQRVGHRNGVQPSNMDPAIGVVGQTSPRDATAAMMMLAPRISPRSPATMRFIT